MRSPLEALVTEKALHFLSARRGDYLMDHVLSSSDIGPIPTKNVCAKVSVQLSDEIDQVCGLLDISKRRFLEAAFVQAVNMSRAIIEREGVLDVLAEDFFDASAESKEAS
jgi:hypothetical protein